MRSLLLALFPLTTACAISAPFEGPGFDPSDGLQSDHDGPFLAVATHTRPKKGATREFGDAVDAVMVQLEDQPGFVGQSLRGEIAGRDRWTLTVWEDEQAMAAFALEGAHLEAMVDSASLIEGVYTAHYELGANELPPVWDDALAELALIEPEEPF